MESRRGRRRTWSSAPADLHGDACRDRRALLGASAPRAHDVARSEQLDTGTANDLHAPHDQPVEQQETEVAGGEANERWAPLTAVELEAVARRHGIDMRMLELRHEAGGAGFGFMSQTGAGDLIRGSTGRIVTTLTDQGLASEGAALETIAHELNHIRGVLRTGVVTEERVAEASARAAGRYFRP